MLPPNPRIPKLTNSTTRTSLVSKPAGVTYTKLAVIAAAVPLVKAAELLSIDNGLHVACESSICKKKFEKYNRFAVDIMSKTTNFFTSQHAFWYMASLCDLNRLEDVNTRRRVFQSSFQMWVLSPRIHWHFQRNSPSFAILSEFFFW